MISFDEFLRRLGEASPEPSAWEKVYEREEVDVGRDEIYEIGNTERVYAEWIVMRFDAGPPGQTLPPLDEAMNRVMQGSPATLLDAYRVVFAEPVSEGVPDELIVALLHNAAMCALQKNGGSWFATWLGARSGLASLALGAPEHAWHLLDLHSLGGVTTTWRHSGGLNPSGTVLLWRPTPSSRQPFDTVGPP